MRSGSLAEGLIAEPSYHALASIVPKRGSQHDGRTWGLTAGSRTGSPTPPSTGMEANANAVAVADATATTTTASSPAGRRQLVRRGGSAGGGTDDSGGAGVPPG